MVRSTKSPEERILEDALHESLPNISRFMRRGYILERVSRTAFDSTETSDADLVLYGVRHCEGY